jgi:hypothetical protein
MTRVLSCLRHTGAAAILQPRTPPAPPQPWADLPNVLDLARRKNAVLKVSGVEDERE